MTKKAMIDTIEKSGMVVDFSRSYLNHKLKTDIERLYYKAVAYMKKGRFENA